MGGGLESRCVGRVYGADGAVLYRLGIPRGIYRDVYSELFTEMFTVSCLQRCL
jgi:hypothetical protein